MPVGCCLANSWWVGGHCLSVGLARGLVVGLVAQAVAAVVAWGSLPAGRVHKKCLTRSTVRQNVNLALAFLCRVLKVAMQRV